MLKSTAMSAPLFALGLLPPLVRRKVFKISPEIKFKSLSVFGSEIAVIKTAEPFDRLGRIHSPRSASGSFSVSVVSTLFLSS